MRVPALAVSSAFFDVVRVRAALGRTFRPPDDRFGNRLRLSLGPAPAGILKLVLGEALVQAAAGLAIGLAAAALVMRLFRSQLFGVGPGDPATLTTVALILFATALAACLPPAVRAMRVDPVETMRGS